MNDGPSGKSHEPVNAPQTLVEAPSMKIEATFDGACEPHNPGGDMGLGWTLNCIGHHRYVPASSANTNNVAEYLALEQILDAALTDPAVGEVSISGDSQLVCCQLSGEYAVRSSSLLPHYQSCSHKIERLRSRGCMVEIHWHPRELNEQADAESKAALAENGVEPMRGGPRAGFGTLTDIASHCGKSAVMVGRCLASLAYRDASGNRHRCTRRCVRQTDCEAGQA